MRYCAPMSENVSEDATAPELRLWPQGSSSARKWNHVTLAVSLGALGAGIVLTNVCWVFLTQVSPEWSPCSVVFVWLGMLTAIAVALGRGIPRGLFRFSPVDLAWGLLLGVALRIADGGIQIALLGTATWPSYPLLDGQLGPTWWFTELLVPVLIAPSIEELFFRGVILVSVYRMARRRSGSANALALAVAVSTAVFVFAHLLTIGGTWTEWSSLIVIGLTLGTLVALTGRIWGAILAHTVYNASFVLLALVGTTIGIGPV